MSKKYLLIGASIAIASIIALALTWTLYISQQSTSGKSTVTSDPSPTPTPLPQYLVANQIPQITLDQIISGQPVVDLSRLDPQDIHTIIATGDIIPARGVDNRIRQHGSFYPFQGKGIAQLLNSGDVTIANLEAPLLDNCPIHNEGFTFCGQSDFAQAMGQAGIDVATLANNHIGNYGQSGITETISHLTEQNIDYADAHRLSITKHNELRIGVLAFNGVGGHFYIEDIANQIKAARPQVDLLIGAFHWGKEYELLPTPDPGIAPNDPRTIAQLAIAAGLDLIIGNHPHWVQGVELMQGKLVTYAYGNFIFDQSWSKETTQGIVGKYTYYRNKLIQAKFIPIIIEDQAQPRIVGGDEAAVIMSKFKQSTQKLQSTATDLPLKYNQ